jgi:dihydrolipoamide dehydrogenase
VASARHDLVVIGAGPGGYVAAIRAAQLGLDVACVEKEKPLGGTCLRIGCIPSKALLESSELYSHARAGLSEHGVGVGDVSLDLAAMMKRKQKTVTTLTRGVSGLFKKNGVTRYEGSARIAGSGRVVVSSSGGETGLDAERILIATGSVSAELPGLVPDGERIVTSTEALSWDEVPGRLVVIGAGAIGLELGSVWSRLGSSVTVLEYLDRILPGIDGETAAAARKLLERQGLDIRTGQRVGGAEANGEACSVSVEGAEPIECDKVLVAVGRRPFTEGLGLEAAGVEADERGRIVVDETYRTSAPGIYAIGDVIDGPMLAHKAEEEGVACVERIATGWGHVDYDAIPNVVYTAPEIASVGRTEEELQESGTPYRKGSFPFIANGRARALGSTDGQVKVLAHGETDRILGVHVLGPRAGDLIAEAAVAISFGASAEDLGRACHAHPTLAEVVKEAALAAWDKPIHI